MKNNALRIDKEHKLYIVISQTGTWFSKIIKLFTKDPYNHSSISLNKELTDMYSFGRKYARLPLPGGFVQECIGKKVFAMHPNTTMIVYELDVTRGQYRKVKKMMRQMYRNRKTYSYNLIGVAFVAMQKEKKRERKYYCSEFVKHVLVKSEIVQKEELPNMCKPMDFLQVNGTKIYEGKMNDYA